ncbi:MAG: redoxin domain-containing protein [Bacteroidales bacterium]|jgi:peroxiredoxin (alkyl hydroperoxide reductase subunit C)|nr:redoxin domain-containing protein [Bacteroidales bacterium]
MKKIVLLAATVLLSSALLTAQADGDKDYRIPLIGEKAPSFSAKSTNGDMVFPDDFGSRWKILFAHPQDFTPVCSSELLELAHLQKDFDKLGVKLAVISTSTLENHVLWKKALEEVSYKGQPATKIKFPLIDDDNRMISRQYGMIHPSISGTKSVRGVFIIDPDNVIQAIYFYPMNVGRSSEELLRSVIALQTADDVLMTPSDWKAGEDLMVAVPPVTDQRTENVPDGFYKLAWFMWFEKAKSKNINP